MTAPEINDPLRNNIKVNGNVGPVSGVDVPRFGGHTTFARLPRIEDVSNYDVAILGGGISGFSCFLKHVNLPGL